MRHCAEHGHTRVALVVNDTVKKDFRELEETDDHAQAVIVGDAFGYHILNHAFRQLMDGAALVALQKNRYWSTPDGLSLDVGAFVAALEYAAGMQAYVVGKPAPAFFAGMTGILVRTGKYRDDVVRFRRPARRRHRLDRRPAGAPRRTARSACRVIAGAISRG